MCVGHGVVPPEQPGGGDVANQHVDAVMLVSDEDADDPGGAEQPAGPVVPPHPARRVWRRHRAGQGAGLGGTGRGSALLTLFDEQVGQRQHDGVAAVQEVTAHQVGAGQRQP